LKEIANLKKSQLFGPYFVKKGEPTKYQFLQGMQTTAYRGFPFYDKITIWAVKIILSLSFW